MMGCLASKGGEHRFVLPPTRRSPLSKKGDKQSRRSFFEKGLCCFMSLMASLNLLTSSHSSFDVFIVTFVSSLLLREFFQWLP